MYLLSVPITILVNFSVIKVPFKYHLILGGGFPSASQKRVVDLPVGNFRLSSTFSRFIEGITKMLIIGTIETSYQGYRRQWSLRPAPFHFERHKCKNQCVLHSKRRCLDDRPDTMVTMFLQALNLRISIFDRFRTTELSTGR